MDAYIAQIVNIVMQTKAVAIRLTLALDSRISENLVMFFLQCGEFSAT